MSPESATNTATTVASNQDQDMYYRMSPENETLELIKNISPNEEDPDKKLATNVYNLLKSQDAADFKNNYKIILDKCNYDTEKAAKQIFEGIQLLVYKIYEGVLNTPPDLDFNNTVSSLARYANAIYQINKTTLYQDLLTKITDLPAKLNDTEIDLQFKGIKIEEKTVIMPDGKTETYSLPIRRYEEMNTSAWLAQVKEVIELERSYLEVSYNLSHILRGGTDGKSNEEPLNAIGAEMRKIKNSSLLSALPGYEDISVGQDTLSKAWMEAFQQNGYQTDGRFLSPIRGQDLKPEQDAKRSLGAQNSWRALRKFIIGVVGEYGERFGPYIYASRAVPLWDGEGPGQFDQGKVARIFNPWHLIERWFGGDQFIHGAALMPAKSGVDNPLSLREKSIELYLQSKKFGLLGIRNDPDYGDCLMWITRSNLFNQGGLDSMGGERLQIQYAGFLRGLFKKGEGVLNDDSTSLRLEYGKDVFRDGFKLVENVGVNIVKNFCEQYVLQESMFQIDEQTGQFKHLDKFESMFKYIFERFFKDNEVNGINGFYSQFSSADEYWAYVKNNVFNRNGIAYDVSWSSRANELRKHLFSAMSIMHMERNPSLILVTEPPHISQNGVILHNELYRRINNSQAEDLKNWGSTDNDRAKNIDEAIMNLSKAETLLRKEITQSMSKDNEFSIEKIYGTFLNENGREFLLNEKKIRDLLKEAGISDIQINQAVFVFNFIRDNLWEKPIADAVIHKEMIDSHGGEEEYRGLEEKLLISRIGYFSQTWESDLLGFQLPIGTANNFLNKEVLGANAISDVIGAINTVTGEFKGFIEGTSEGDSIYSLIDTFSRQGGEENLKTICERLNTIYSKMKTESPDMAKRALVIAGNMIIQALKAPINKSLLSIPGLNAIIPPDKQSLAGSDKVAGNAEEFVFTEEEIKNFIDYFINKNILPTNQNASTSELVPKTPQEIIEDTALGDFSTHKYVTKATSLNANDILENYKATAYDLFKKMVGPAAIFVLIPFLLTILKGGYDMAQE